MFDTIIPLSHAGFSYRSEAVSYLRPSFRNQRDSAPRLTERGPFPLSEDSIDQLKADLLTSDPQAVRDAVNAQADEFWDAATRLFQITIQQDDPFLITRHLAQAAIAMREAERTAAREVEERQTAKVYHLSSEALPVDQAAAIWDALRCNHKGCSCAHGKTTHCPAHNDRNPSFSVSVKGGRLLVNCLAGCSQTAVLSALTTMGLWKAPRVPGSPPPAPRPLQGPRLDEGGGTMRGLDL